ncbi:MAG: glutaredoxin 3 [Gammaproteobacteria bacterium]|nr:glutaredoxin 3 [Gammaproteobacteria bacterium]QOJ32842.1 MAG: glutaredoxin 3 [Gammaproteobacteria bacterium]
MNHAAEVVIYTKPTCPYCAAAKALLKGKGVSYREIDIAGDDGRREEMIARSGRRTVPQVFIGSRHVGGFDDLSALDQQGGLDPLLGISR